MLAAGLARVVPEQLAPAVLLRRLRPPAPFRAVAVVLPAAAVLFALLSLWAKLLHVAGKLETVRDDVAPELYKVP